MADFDQRLDEFRVPASPAQIIGGVEEVCRAFFPSDAEVTCNRTRVEASIDLGESVQARIIIDVDPVNGDPSQTRVSGSFSASGPGLRSTDERAIAELAQQVFVGVRGAVARGVRRSRGMDLGLE